MQRVRTVLLLVLTVVVLSAAGYVLAHNDPVPHAGEGPRLPLTAGSPSAPTSTSAPARSAETRVAFLGDDYTAGVGASSSEKAFPALVSDALGWTPTVIGLPLAGYAHPGPDQRTYRDGVARVVAAAPDIVVVTGGRNDVPDYPPTLRSATRSLFAELHRRLPDAVLVAVAPFWGNSTHPDKLTPIDSAVQAGVERASGTYLPLEDPLVGHREFMKDERDPNDRGQAAIARALEPALADLLPGSTQP